MNIPKIRFTSFNSEYNDVIFSTLANKISKRNKGNIITNVISNSAVHGLISQRDFFEKDIANNDNTENYYIIEKNDFVYNPRKSNEAPYGPINLYKYDTPGVISPLYLCFKTKNINPNYLEYYFKSPFWHRYIYLNGDSGARHDRVSIKDDVFFNMNIKIPSKEEQLKVSNFLSLLDKKIELQTKKIEDLKLFKKGLDKKIFSNKDFFTTDIINNRFDSDGGTALEEYISSNGTHRIISIGNYSPEGTYIDNNQRITLNDKTKTKLLNKDNLVMILNDKTTTGDIIGSSILIEENNKYIFNQRSQRLICKNINPRYAWCFLNSISFRKRIFKMAQGGTQIYVNFPTIMSQKILIPKDKIIEKMIINIIFGLKNKIDKETVKLNNLIELKKGLMQNMFV